MVVYFMIFEILQISFVKIYEYIKGKDMEIEPTYLLITSILGLIVNLIMIKMIHHHPHEDHKE